MNLLNFLDLSKIYKNWPLPLSIAILWITIIILYLLSLEQNNGNFCYVMDDPYIHMAIAKHFAQNGIWGVTIYGFSSSASSILWPLMLSSIYYIFGVNEITPFILNIIFASIILGVTYFILKSLDAKPVYNFIVLCSLIFIIPLPLLIFCGMEHTLHILLSILFIYIATLCLTTENKGNLKYFLIISAILLAMVRYEGLFLIFIASILFLIKRKYVYFLSLIGISLLPVIIYGAISILNGWDFLPNSLIAKSSFFSGFNIFSLKTLINMINNTFKAKPAYFLIISLPIYYFIAQTIKNRSLWNFTTILATLFIFSAIIHLFLEPVSWYYRHEAYIIAIGILTVAIIVNDYLNQNLELKFNKINILRYTAILLLIFVLLSPFAGRAYTTVQIPDASHSIYEQQYQMGLFLKEFYQGEPVAANDIGAINYLGDIKCLDILGLGSMSIIQEMRNIKQTDKKSMIYRNNLEYLTEKNNVKVVIVYDFLLKNEKPKNWIKVGEWKIPKKMYCANEAVSFYVLNSKDEKELIKNLQDYSSKLPKDVNQSGNYMM